MANKIGRFEIQSEISRSPIGFVFKANDPDTGQLVALKTLRLEAIGEHVHEMVQRLVQEAQGTGSLSSHNIAQLHGVDEIDGQFCAAMEYVQGNSVATILARNEGFSIWDVKDIARQACQALDHAHSRKIFHHSLEPDKIVTQWDGLVKILGFGISAMSIPSSQLHQVVPRIVHYMSPEQVRGEALDARSNLFSLAAILYEMLTEQKAFDGESEDDVKRQILEGNPVPPHQINNKVGADVSAAVLKALSKTPTERYQTGQDLVMDLEGRKEETVSAAAKKAPAAAKKPVPPARGINAPQKNPAPAPPVASEPVASAPEAAAPSGPAAPSKAAAAVAAAGWSGSASAVAKPAARKSQASDLTGFHDPVAAQPAKSRATMSAAPVEESPAETPSFATDPMMDENKPAKGASRSFSEISELPPLKEVYVAPPPPPPPPPAEGQAEEPAPELVSARLRAVPPPKPRVQPKVVAKKAVQEIQKTPPKLFIYSIAGAVAVILLVVIGIAYHIRSQGPTEESSPDLSSVRQPAEPAPAKTVKPVAPAPVRQEPDAITVESRPAVRKPKTPPPAPVVVTGQITVTSNPDGALIQLDGQGDPSWLTPLDLTNLTPGHHTVTVSKAGYAPQTRSIEVGARSKSVMSLQLALLAATLSVTSEPAGAKVLLDGKDTGRVTPIQFSIDKPGNHSILVRKDGYLEESTTLNLQTGLASNFAPTLRKLGMTDEIKFKKFLGGGAPDGSGTVNIKTDPKGAQIAVNRRILDKPSPVLFYLNPGTYVIDVTASGYKAIHRVINVERDGKVSIDERMERE